MTVNRDKVDRWKEDIAQSVDLYNQWFFSFAPLTFIETRRRTTDSVESAFLHTQNLIHITPATLTTHPSILPILRMSTAPPIARERLIGLAGVSKSLVASMEDVARPRLPAKMAKTELDRQLELMGDTIRRLADQDLCPWLADNRHPTEVERHRAATVVADRLCGTISDPLIRNAQEKWQLDIIAKWLQERGYIQATQGTQFKRLSPGQFAFRLNAKGLREDGKTVAIPIDVVIMPLNALPVELPLLVEAKSAGDFTNVNKRRKEEADKLRNLKRLHGTEVRFILYLRGYFDAGYLGYEASEGIDWVWEHRTDDLAKFGV